MRRRLKPLKLALHGPIVIHHDFFNHLYLSLSLSLSGFVLTYCCCFCCCGSNFIIAFNTETKKTPHICLYFCVLLLRKNKKIHANMHTLSIDIILHISRATILPSSVVFSCIAFFFLLLLLLLFNIK